MLKAKILFSVPKGPQWYFLSWFFRFIQYRKTIKPFNFFGLYHSSHVAILIDHYVYEAVFWLGVRKIPFREWNRLNTVKKHYEISITNHSFEKGLIFLEASQGISYAFIELLGMFWQKFLKTFFNRKIYTNPIKTKVRKYKCSELVYNWLIIVDFIWGKRDPDLVDVADIEEIVS